MKNKVPAMSRAPFAPIRRLLEVPVALLEIKVLVEEGRLEDAKALIDSVIATTLPDPQAWLKVANLKPKEVGIESQG